MRLIDADSLIAKSYIAQETKGFIHSVVTERQICNAPTIDAVPVVRCKDCKFWERGDCYRLELSRPDDFCSYGVRL